MRVQFRKKVIGERTGAMSGTSKIPERFSAVPGFPTKSVSGNLLVSHGRFYDCSCSYTTQAFPTERLHFRKHKNPRNLCLFDFYPVSSLFHDVGKRNVSLDILCKKGPLDENEWVQMRMHPQFGLKILNEHSGLSDAVKAACYEHHESWSGGGYPQDISGQEIHPFARIVSLTDTYDAMTTQRSYNVPMKPTEALNMMKNKLSSKYDPEMLKAMYSVLFKMEKTGSFFLTSDTVD